MQILVTYCTTLLLSSYVRNDVLLKYHAYQIYLNEILYLFLRCIFIYTGIIKQKKYFLYECIYLNENCYIGMNRGFCHNFTIKMFHRKLDFLE